MAGLATLYEIIVLLFLAVGSEGEIWNYPDMSIRSDVDLSKFPICVNGLHQSPINIDVQNTTYDKTLTSLGFNGYSKAQNGTMTNTEKTLMYKPTSGAVSTIKDGPLNGSTYTLYNFHFHFGSSDDKGSDHAINGSPFPAEIHFVHYNSDKYPFIENASNQSDGLAFIAVFVKIGDTNSQIDSLHIDQLQYEGDITSVSQLSLWDLLPADKSYYTYFGSSTSPPCYESVRWIVMNDTITMSSSQMARFRAARDTKQGVTAKKPGDGFVYDNFRRPLKPLNGRSVTRNFELDASSSPSSPTSSSSPSTITPSPTSSSSPSTITPSPTSSSSSSTITPSPTSGGVQLVASKSAVCLQYALIVVFVKLFGI